MNEVNINRFPSKWIPCSVYALGSSDYNQSGIPFEEPYLDHYMYNEEAREHDKILLKPTCLNLKPYLLRVVCGSMHTLAIASDGELYSWGCNDDGALGHAGSGISPEKVDIPTPVLQVSAGDNHCLAIAIKNKKRNVYFWGSFRVRVT